MRVAQRDSSQYPSRWLIVPPILFHVFIPARYHPHDCRGDAGRCARTCRRPVPDGGGARRRAAVDSRSRGRRALTLRRALGRCRHRCACGAPRRCAAVRARVVRQRPARRDPRRAAAARPAAVAGAAGRLRRAAMGDARRSRRLARRARAGTRLAVRPLARRRAQRRHAIASLHVRGARQAQRRVPTGRDPEGPAARSAAPHPARAARPHRAARSGARFSQGARDRVVRGAACRSRCRRPFRPRGFLRIDTRRTHSRAVRHARIPGRSRAHAYRAVHQPRAVRAAARTGPARPVRLDRPPALSRTASAAGGRRRRRRWRT